MTNNPLDVDRVQATLSQTTRQRGPLGQLLKDIEVGLIVYFLVLFLFWLVRRHWGLGLLTFFATWIGYACAGLRDWWAIPPAMATGALVGFVAHRAATIRAACAPPRVSALRPEQI
jgi:hypothetical protein